jgi:hypothetical protein
MSNLVPDPGDRNDSQLTPNDRDSPNLYFRDLIVQQQSALASTTDISEYKQRLEIIQMAIDLSDKKTAIDIKTAQDEIKLEVARIELSDLRVRSTEVTFKTTFKIIFIPLFIIAGAYIWYSSESTLGSALLFLGLGLALSNEDAIKSLSTIKDLLPK